MNLCIRSYCRIFNSKTCDPSFQNLAKYHCVSIPNKINDDRFNFYVLQRFKSKKTKRNKGEQIEEDEEDDIDTNIVAGKGAEIKQYNVGSMRTDLLLKMGLGIARNKVEEAFYESKIRVNSKKILKKSTELHVGDEVDLIKGSSPTNPNFLTVGRVEILAVKADEDGINVKIRKSKSLIIDNYPDGDPWKPSESVSAE